MTQASAPGPRLEFAVLGPIRVRRGDASLPTGSPQQRALLAALLLRGGHTATAPELVDALWGEEPPDAALAALRTYASRLRKAFGEDADLLVSESGGYALRTEPDGLDLTRAEQLAALSDEARADGDRHRARDLLDAALALWDGEALAAVPGPYAERQRVRLQEWRLQLLESRIDLDLELGCHAEAVSELTALTAAHPLREHLRGQLMLALYRSGRQAEALAFYADTRRLLADELGVDPCAELTALHQRILEADPALSAPSAETAEQQATLLRPAQLPATVPDFTGREGSVRELSGLLTTAEGSVMAVSAVAGIGGVGKTTLAVHVAHAARASFPDGQLYVDLQGAGSRPAEPETVLASFLRALGTPDTAIPDTLDERAALYRSALDGRRLLILLDNARDAAQIRPLLPGTDGCAALITSRTRMMGLAGAHLVDLDVMSPEEALALFTRIVGQERVALEREAALDVVAACGYLPLAIRIAASRLAARRAWTVSVLAAKLGDERRRLDELQAGDLAVKATFELGYGQLEPQQARAFRLLGLADGPDISLAAAAVMLDLDVYETEELLESLVDVSLLESAAPGRYRYHDLVRLYARACAERDEHPPSRRADATSRLLDFYLATATRVYALARPGDRTVHHLEAARHPGLDFADRSEALDWLHQEAGCILACAQQAAADGQTRRAVDLLLASKDLCESGANDRNYERATRAILEAARDGVDTWAERRARATLTSIYSITGRFWEGDEEARIALQLQHPDDDPWATCNLLNDRGIIALYEKRHAEGEEYLRQAIACFHADDNRIGEASALCNLSRIRLAMGRTDSAVDLARQGLAIYDAMGLTVRLANARYALGLALTAAGRLAEALDELTQALGMFHAHRQPLWEGVTHFRVAEVHLAAGRPTLAATHAEQAIALGGIGGEWRRGTVLTVLGKALDTIGQPDRARACWTEALSIYERLGSAEADEVRGLLAPAAVA